MRKIYSTRAGAFAALLGNGTVVSWGHSFFGGNNSGVQDQLQNVLEISASSGAFAARLQSGRVVTWGNPTLGGDSQEQGFVHVSTRSNEPFKQGPVSYTHLTLPTKLEV